MENLLPQQASNQSNLLLPKCLNSPPIRDRKLPSCRTIYWKVLENNFGFQQQLDAVALSKSCIVFLSIILARDKLLINMLEHIGATDDRLEEKKAWKPLESNYFWITRWHYQVTVLHICQFSHIPCLPLSSLYLFRQSGPMCPNVHFYETLWTSASWADKAPPENRLATAHILCNRFILLCLSVPSWCVAQQCQQVDGILHSGPNSQISLKEMFLGGVGGVSWTRWDATNTVQNREFALAGASCGWNYLKNFFPGNFPIR